MQEQPKGFSPESADAETAQSLGAALMPDSTAILGTIIAIITIMLGWMSFTLEVFVRHEFGERHLSWTRIALAYLSTTSFIWVLNIGLALQGFQVSLSGARSEGFTPYTSISPAFIGAFITLALFHKARIMWRNNSGIRWHSRNMGISILQIPHFPILRNEWIIYRFIEPMFCWLAADLLFFAGEPTHTWMKAAAVALFIRNHIAYLNQRYRILDIRDGRIEAEYFNNVAAGGDKARAQGFLVSVSRRQPTAPPPRPQIDETAAPQNGNQATAGAELEPRDLAEIVGRTLRAENGTET